MLSHRTAEEHRQTLTS